MPLKEHLYHKKKTKKQGNYADGGGGGGGGREKPLSQEGITTNLLLKGEKIATVL